MELVGSQGENRMVIPGSQGENRMVIDGGRSRNSLDTSHLSADHSITILALVNGHHQYGAKDTVCWLLINFSSFAERLDGIHDLLLISVDTHTDHSILSANGAWHSLMIAIINILVSNWKGFKSIGCVYHSYKLPVTYLEILDLNSRFARRQGWYWFKIRDCTSIVQKTEILIRCAIKGI